MTMRNICGIDVDVRKKDIKNLHIRVKEGPRVIVSVPKRCSDGRIVSLIEKKKDWILAAMQREHLSKTELSDSCEIELIGRKFTVHITHGNRESVKIIDNEIFIVSSDSDEDLLLRKVHRTVLESVLPGIFGKLQSTSGLSCSSWYLRYMTSRWGTCNTRTKRICLSTNLAKRPIECIEYVVMHELVHTVVPNHGQNFKILLTNNMPDWKERKKLLNS